MRYFHMHRFPRQGSPIKTGNWVCLMSQKTISSAEFLFGSHKPCLADSDLNEALQAQGEWCFDIYSGNQVIQFIA